jgi:amino acid adenylation domain-containing protein
MQAIRELLGRLRERNIQLSVNGDKLSCSAPKGAITPQLKEELTRHKAELMTALAGAASASEASVPRLSRHSGLPVSSAQRRLWFLQRYDPASFAYNDVVAVRLRGSVHTNTLADACRAAVFRHESLHTAFQDIDGVLKASVVRRENWQPEIAQLDGDDDAFEARLLELAVAAAKRPFDLRCPPLLHVTVVRRDDREHVLVFVSHQIAADRQSLRLLIRDALRAYAKGSSDPTPASDSSRIQFADYAAWREALSIGDAAFESLDFWKGRLAGPLPVLELPSERLRPALMTFEGRRRSIELTSRQYADVSAFARREGASQFAVLLTAFKALLYRYTARNDVIIGTQVTGRERPEVVDVIGPFANTLAIRTSLTEAITGRDLTRQVADAIGDATSHASVPFDELVAALPLERDLSHPALVQILFSFTEEPPLETAIDGVSAEPIPIDPGIARLDLSVEASASNDRLRLDFEYNTDLFDDAGMARLQHHYTRVLDDLIARPDTAISKLTVLTEAEEAELRERGAATAIGYASNERLEAIVDVRLRARPNRIAVRCDDESRTAAAVIERSAQIAAALRDRGVGHGDVVAVCLDRSADMPVVLLGILKAGAAYVPLDPIYPADRLEYMLADSGARVIVADRHLSDRLPAADVPVLWLDAHWWDTAAQAPPVAPQGDASDLAYVLYTSGSTGRPKGVEITHRSLVNFLESMRQQPGLTADDRLVAVTTLCFDISGLEMYLPLLTGAELVVAARTTVADPRELAALLSRAGATVMQATPATWRMLLDSGWPGLTSLRVFCGGEALTRELADRLLACGCEVWNLYGPTETTIWSTVERIEPGTGAITVGRPIANTTTYVFDRNLQPLPQGVPGELCIGGDGVARGYHNRPDLTDQMFIPDPFVAGGRLYRTGDQARLRADGRLEVLGRLDRQVKIRGFRVELGEIEAALEQLDDVAAAAVVIQGTGDAQQLIGFVTTTSGPTLDSAALRAMLAKTLPDYMVPARVVTLEAFPLTPNGKVDRKALPAVVLNSDVANFVPPSDDLEREIAGIWRGLLKVDRVARNDNFFDIGGHSLLVVQMQSRLRSAFGADVPLVELFQRPTVRAIAAFLQRTRSQFAMTLMTLLGALAWPQNLFLA